MLGVIPADKLKHPVSGVLDCSEAVGRENPGLNFSVLNSDSEFEVIILKELSSWEAREQRVML